MILQYKLKYFLSILDDPLWVSIFTPSDDIFKLLQLAWRVFIFIFQKSIHRFDSMSCDGGVAGIVEGSHSVSNLSYLSMDPSAPI